MECDSRSLSNTNSKKGNKSDKPEKTEWYKLPNSLVIVLAIINSKLLEADEALELYAFS
jgi:hypothetical protein